MTGPSAPSPPAGRAAHPGPQAGQWPPALLPGLWVDLGDWHSKRHVWLRPPAARFTCRHGCAYDAYGARDVARLTEHIDEDHARQCPGPQRTPDA